jgi:eukaryotic-like serine/threonine-protein kinase
MNERELFTAASLIEDRKLRESFLATVCQGDSALQQRIESLLLAGEIAENLIGPSKRVLQHLAGEGSNEVNPMDLEHGGVPPNSVGNSSGPSVLQAGTTIGNYHIQQFLGEGGMGVVYAAKQSEPIKRQVALKILRPSDASRSILARFEQERHALAMMDHPGIARILDAGSTEDGIPYFVMELIKGVPIHQYCDQENLAPEERLQLFLPVCSAVQHAHQKGIIHRDLKPSNILIGLYDGKPIPKVIDFGVAKAIGSTLADLSVFTEIGSVVGTVEYMAPEQAELNNLDIDTRADIYSLGVVLYELLTGSPPFSRQQLRSAAFDEMLRIIREVDPPKPSTKVSSSDEVARVAAHRKLEPKQLAKALSGDLDWVVMKSLAKERSRRYQTVSEFSSDIDRFLRIQPVLAGPPSLAYRARRFLKRNKVLSLATALTVFAILSGGIAATLGYLESYRQFDIAKQAESKERLARELAEKRLTQVENGIEILSSVFEQLNPESVDETSGDLRGALVEQLHQSAQQIRTRDLGDSIVVARLQYKLGLALLKLGEPNAAIQVLESAEQSFHSSLGEESLDLLNCIEVRALCLRTAGKLKESLDLSQQILASKQKVLGPTHLDTITAVNNLGLTYGALGDNDKAISSFTQAVELLEANFGADAPATMTSQNNLALYRLQGGDVKNSRDALEIVLAKRTRILGPDHPDTLSSMMSFAMALRLNSEFKHALTILEKAVTLTRAKYGNDHPKTILSISNLAMVWKDLGDNVKAVPFLEQVERYRRMKMGSEHPSTLQAMANLAVAYKESGRLNEAMPLYLESLEKRRKVLGPEHEDTLTSMNNLGTTYLKQRKFDEAIALLEECLLLRTKTLGENHPAVGITQLNLARTFQEAGRLEDAVYLYRQTLEQRQRSFASDHPRVLTAMYSLAIPLRSLKRFDEAIELIKTALERGQKLDGGLPHDMKQLPEMLAEVYKEAGRLDEAEQQMRSILESYQASHGKHHHKSLLTQLYLGQLLLQRDKVEEAEKVLRENLDLRVEAQPDDWQTFMSQGILGGLQLKKQQFAEAEVLLKEAYEGLSARTTLIPPDKRETRLAQVRKWLADLYRSTDRGHEADKLAPADAPSHDGT